MRTLTRTHACLCADMDDADKPDDLNESDNSDDSDDSLMTS